MTSGRGVVAVVRDAPVLVDWRATLDKAARLMAETGALGARLVLFHLKDEPT